MQFNYVHRLVVSVFTRVTGKCLYWCFKMRTWVQTQLTNDRWFLTLVTQRKTYFFIKNELNRKHPSINTQTNKLLMIYQLNIELFSVHIWIWLTYRTIFVYFLCRLCLDQGWSEQKQETSRISDLWNDVNPEHVLKCINYRFGMMLIYITI